MKAVLEFNLPEDSYEFNLCRDVKLYKASLYEISQWLRNRIKCGSDELSDDELKILYEFKDKLVEILEEHNVDPYLHK
jgi:hypothetical protein